MFNIPMTSEQLDKLLVHVESMIETCDESDLPFYQEWYDSLTKE